MSMSKQSSLIYQGSRISLGTILVSQEGSSKTTLKEIVYHPGAVVIIPITDKGDLVMIEQYRISIDKKLLELPAGTRENGEDFIQTADRELSEETKFGANSLTDIGTLYPAPGFCNEEQKVIIAKGLYSRDLPADFGEEISTRIMTISSVIEAIREGSIVDSKTISALYLAHLHGHIDLCLESNRNV